MGDRPTGERGPRDRATGAVQDDIATAGRDGGSEEDVGDDATGGRVRRVERLQDQVDRAARRSDAGRGGDHASRISAHVDRTRAGVRDAGEGDLRRIRTSAGIERERTGEASRRGEGQRDRLGDGARGDDADARSGVDGGLNVGRADIGDADVREITGERAGGARRVDDDVAWVDQPRAAEARLDEAGKFEEIARGLDPATKRAHGTGYGGDALRVRDVGPEDGRAALPCVDRRASRERGDERLADAVGTLPVAADEDGAAVRREGRAREHGDMVTSQLDGAGGNITSDGDTIGVDGDLGTGDFGARGDRHGIRTTERDGAIGIARARSGPHEAGDVDGLVDDFAGGGGGKHDASGGDLAGLFDLRRKRLAIRADEGGGEAFAEGERDQAIASEVDGQGLAGCQRHCAEVCEDGAGVTDIRSHEGT